MKRKIAKTVVAICLLLATCNLIVGDVGGEVVCWLRLHLEGYPGWEANQGHFMEHPVSLVFTLVEIALPVVLGLALLNKRSANLVAIGLLGYIPFYVVYGTFFYRNGSRHGFAPSPVAWLVLVACVALGALGLWWNCRTSEPTDGGVGVPAPRH